jgi:hypothetical protein
MAAEAAEVVEVVEVVEDTAVAARARVAVGHRVRTAGLVVAAMARADHAGRAADQVAVPAAKRGQRKTKGGPGRLFSVPS